MRKCGWLGKLPVKILFFPKYVSTGQELYDDIIFNDYPQSDLLVMIYFQGRSSDIFVALY